jgi:hypothetical protein
MRLTLALITLPPTVFFKRLLGKYKELYIVTPDSSSENSPETSQRISPNSTLPIGKDVRKGQRSAAAGTKKEV